MVIVRRFFRRIFELWHTDMGLGSIDPRFDAMREEDLDANVDEEDVVDPDVEEDDDNDAVDDHEGIAGGPVDMDKVD